MIEHLGLLLIELENKVRVIKIRVLNSLPVELVIGLNFLKIFSISVNYENRKWTFNNDPYKTFDFIIEEWNSVKCFGLNELTNDQAKILKEFLEKEIPEDQGKPG